MTLGTSKAIPLILNVKTLIKFDQFSFPSIVVSGSKD